MLRIAATIALLLAPLSTVNAADPPSERMDQVMRGHAAMNQFMAGMLVE